MSTRRQRHDRRHQTRPTSGPHHRHRLTKKCRNPPPSSHCRGRRACRSEAGLCKRMHSQVSEHVMSHRLRPLRLFVLCCAAAAIAAPVSAQQPANPQAATAQPQGQAQPSSQASPSRPPPRLPPAKPPAQAAQPALKDPVVATVNGQPIRLSELEVAQQSLPQQYRNMPLQAVFPALLDRIVDSKLVVPGGQEEQGHRGSRLQEAHGLRRGPGAAGFLDPARDRPRRSPPRSCSSATRSG